MIGVIEPFCSHFAPQDIMGYLATLISTFFLAPPVGFKDSHASAWPFQLGIRTSHF